MLKNNKFVAKPRIVDVYEQIPRRKEYQPAITIRDLPSLGRSSRISGIKTGRQHDFLSDIVMCNYFFSSPIFKNEDRGIFSLRLKLNLHVIKERLNR